MLGFISGNAVTNFLICFSVIKNTKSILSTHVPTGVVGSLNGIRALSMTWVILGHIYYFGALSSVGMYLFSPFKV